MNLASRDKFADKFDRFYQEKVSGYVYQGTWHIFRYADDSANEFYWDGSKLYLTTASTWKGSIGYIPVRFNHSSPYETLIVRFRFLAGGGSGADGFHFGIVAPYYYHRAMQGTSMGGTLGIGEPIYHGYNCGLIIVEFDNYQNGADPSANHIGISVAYPAPPFGGLSWRNVPEHVVSYVNTGITEDNAWHNCFIHVKCGRVKVVADNVTLFSPLSKNHKTSFRYHEHVPHLSFGAGTGSLNNNHIIDDVEVRVVRYKPRETGVMSTTKVM